MKRFALDGALVEELAGLIRWQDDRASDVRPAALDVREEEAAEVFARAAWTVLTEPGDRAAAEVLEALGAPAALELLVAGATAGAVEAAMGEAGHPPAHPAALTAALDRWRPRVSAATVRRAIESAHRRRVRLVVPSDTAWPGGLDDLGDGRPTALWVMGELERLSWFGRSIAIVGARAATGYGDHVASEFAAGLAAREWAIVSGGAYGIDGSVHRAALAVDGATVAFLAGGLDRFYPSGHEELLSAVASRGLVISEVPCGVAPTRWRFLMRNRLMAAATLATVIVEAGARSGSLNTAHHAADLGRPIGAVPGPITSPSSAGCHRILRELPSECVTSVAEVEALVEAVAFEQPEAAQESPDRVRVIDALSRKRPRDIDDIARRTGMSHVEVTRVLGPLELERRVAELDEGWVLC